MINTHYVLETPEGIELRITPAGPVARGLALAIDSLIRYSALLALYLSLTIAGRTGFGAFLILWFVAEWFYPVFFEVLASGQTPGKRLLGLRTLHSDGTPIGWSASLIRNLLRTADFLPAFYVVGVVSMLCSRRFSRLGDLAAGTVVVRESSAVTRADSPAALGDGAAIDGVRVSRAPLTGEDQRAILSFSERVGELSNERAAELANLLETVTGRQGNEAVVELLQIANGIAGRR